MIKKNNIPIPDRYKDILELFVRFHALTKIYWDLGEAYEEFRNDDQTNAIVLILNAHVNVLQSLCASLDNADSQIEANRKRLEL